MALPSLPAVLSSLAEPGRELLLLPSAWIVVTVAYLVGAIPFGLLIAKRVAGIDLRSFGSGNIGTSNAVRAMGRRWGFVVFSLDFLKGFLPVLACHRLVGDHAETVPLLQVLTGTAAVLGHCFPIYLGFRGGKGVATGCGAIIAIDFRVFLCGGVVWLVTRLITRYAGLASIMMGITFPIAVLVLDEVQEKRRPELLVGSLLLTLLILVRHRSNVRRMLQGTEPHIGEKVETAERRDTMAESPDRHERPERDVKKALVIGDGGWGTTLALLLHRNGIPTCLWSAFPEQAEEMRSVHENRRFLPGVHLPREIEVTADPYPAADGADLVVSVVPTQYLRGVATRFEDALSGSAPIVTATKGIEIETFMTPSSILLEILGERPICVLTGPSHAEEVAIQKPAAVLAASQDRAFAQRVQGAFASQHFRVYTHDDPLGAELAAALKNVIAIAAGISDGLDLGDNSKAALITRGMVEIARFGRSRGASPRTFFGLAGIGDLVTTCCSKHSRNRAVGEAIGRGQSLEQVLSMMKMVAEGVWTAKALFGPESDLENGVSMPIAEQVHAVLFEGKDPREAVLDLMSRTPTGEMDGLIEGRA